ncbi:glycosyltransferase [Methylobacterium sp. E-005]|uniref:glycosyltransferase family 2 protein n=1 Tax=Methylobacterium sp. E-005 TaxID=2836549 RepID=UPI001FB8EDDB|nr:glycosyltransferase family 2 protein [Methylobacterium sp. E-005]MCJ2087481.1 glycosyltransferase [Methylobacterium sp. E-005]
MKHEAGLDAAAGVELVSVAVTLYNYEAHIAGALSTVVSQTHRAVDLVIVDDCSTDRSLDEALIWIEQNGQRLTRVRLFRNQENYGLSASRNVAFAEAIGDFVMVLDADNELMPTAIEKLLSACQASGADAAYSIIENFDAEKSLGYAFLWNPERLSGGNYIDAMALIRKKAWSAAGGYFQFEIDGWEDYDLWCSFTERDLRAAFVPEILCRYRVHKSSMLRATTNVNHKELSAQIMLRHPWIRL